ncbi:MAG: radical SAM protein [Nitrospiraceae bacterium]
MEYRDFSRRIHDRAAADERVIKAQLELTYRCNLHCLHCYTDPYNSKQWFPRELSMTEIMRLIDEMAELGIVWLNLTGGEIFQHQHFWDIYDHAYRRGFLLELYTNGTLFTRSIIDRLQHAPPFTIDISCHSVNEERFDWFTQVPGSFRAFVRGLRLLKAAGLPFTLKTKAMNWNRDELPQIKHFVESFGQSFGYTTSLSPRLNGDLSSLAYRLPPEEVVALQRASSTVNPSEDDCHSAADLSPPRTDRLFRCGCATNTIHINAWGELGTCTLQYERRVSLRAYPLPEAIEQLFNEIRALRYQSESPCRTCKVHTFCDKKPSDARWECQEAEAPIPYDCNIAVARAEATWHQPLIHPLRKVRKKTAVHYNCEKPI